MKLLISPTLYTGTCIRSLAVGLIFIDENYSLESGALWELTISKWSMGTALWWFGFVSSNAVKNLDCIKNILSEDQDILGVLVAQAVRRSPPTAGVPSSRIGPSMWVSWWTKRGLSRFFTGFLPFSPTTNFIPPFLNAHLIHFVSFHQPLWWCVRRGRPAPLLLTDI